MNRKINVKQPLKKEKQPLKRSSRTRKDANAGRDQSADEQEVCTKAPEWAEHSRLGDDDEPCDDGRSG